MMPDDEIPSESSDDDPDFSSRRNTKQSSSQATKISVGPPVHRTGKRGISKLTWFSLDSEL